MHADSLYCFLLSLFLSEHAFISITILNTDKDVEWEGIQVWNHPERKNYLKTHFSRGKILDEDRIKIWLVIIQAEYDNRLVFLVCFTITYLKFLAIKKLNCCIDYLQ